jgi:regulatory protein
VATPTCYDQALRLLGRRAHFRAELAQKLRRRGFGVAEVEETLGRLIEQRYINDESTAQLFAEQQARRLLGRQRLSSELKRRGVDRELARQTLDQALPDEEEAANTLVANLLRRAKKPDAAKIARFLANRGFAAATIAKSLRRAAIAAAELEVIEAGLESIEPVDEE